MITAVEEAQLAQRRRIRAGSSGTVFSVPALPGIADFMMAMPTSQTSCIPAPSSPPPASSLDLTGFLGKSVGSGQCVALVRAAHPDLGPSSTWKAGSPVEGNYALQPGTPIATFNPSNQYANATDGSSHAAIYLGQNAQGVTVLDQWAGSSASVRTIPWSKPGATAANTGASFRVVQAG